jgi:branched-chain amino acid transport system substrate-binding protein
MKQFFLLELSLVVILSLILTGCSTSSSTSTIASSPTKTTSLSPTNTTSLSSSTSAINTKAPTSSTSAPTASTPVSTTTSPAITNTSPKSTETIKIGVSLPLSGAFAGSAAYITPVLKMRVNDVNASGGVLGRKLELVIRDNLGDPSLQSQVLSQLKQAGCVAILGVILSSDFYWATNNQIPLLGAIQDNEIRTKKFSKYGFYAGVMDFASTQVLAAHIVPLTDIKSMYMIATDINFAHETWESLWPVLNQKRPDIKNLGQTYVGMSETDFSSTISALLAKKTDYLFVLLGPLYTSFLQQAQNFGLSDKMSIGGCWLLGPSTSAPFGSDYPVGIQSIDTMPFWLNTPGMQAFVKEFYDQTQLYPDNLTSWYDYKILSLIAAIKKAGGTDPDQLVAAFEGLQFDSPTGTIIIDPWDHQYEVPVYYSTSGYSPDFSIAIGMNTERYLEGIYPTKDEILAMRAAP